MSTNLAQAAYTQTLQHLVAHGRGPHYTELAEILRVPVEEARGAQVAAAEAGVGCWVLDEPRNRLCGLMGTVLEHSGPVVDGVQKWYGQ